MNPLGVGVVAAMVAAVFAIATWGRRHRWRDCPRCGRDTDWTRQGVAGGLGGAWDCHGCGARLWRGWLFLLGCAGMALSLGLGMYTVASERYPLIRWGILLQTASMVLVVAGQRVRLVYPPGRCPSCGYDAAGSAATTCPECGRSTGAAQ